MSAGLETFLGAGSATFVAEATLSGKLYDLGEYPGVTLGEGGGEVVAGELWRVGDELHWPALDDFEGIGPGYPAPTLYRRVLAKAQTDTGGAVGCWVYVYNRAVDAAPVIASGDWARR